jgi:hypothetical protein
VRPERLGYGPLVPARPADHITTEELLAATRSTRDKLYEWVAMRLLPRPRITTGPDGGQFAVWPTDTVERVRLILDRLDTGATTVEIAELMHERWPRR